MKKVNGKSKPVRINVKLKEDCMEKTQLNDLAVTQGVINVIQTFPNGADRELACIYILEVERSQAIKVLQNLRESNNVDYAEETPTRKLIRRAA